MAGKLRKNESKRWEFPHNGYPVELTCGDVVEVEVGGDWLSGRIEHSRRDGYYLLLAEDMARP